MSLYRYATNRAALLDGVTEMVLHELAIFVDDCDWQAQLRRIGHDLRPLGLRHPNVVPLLVTRPLSTPLGLRSLGTLRPLEQILALLIAQAFLHPTPCTTIAPTTDSSRATSSTNPRNTSWTRTRTKPSSAAACTACRQRIFQTGVRWARSSPSTTVTLSLIRVAASYLTRYGTRRVWPG
jgi:hypothetical protein